jgi:hypothetical protein
VKLPTAAELRGISWLGVTTEVTLIVVCPSRSRAAGYSDKIKFICLFYTGTLHDDFFSLFLAQLQHCCHQGLAIVKLIPNNNCRDGIFRAHSQKNFKPFFIANRNSNKRSGLPALSSLQTESRERY